MAADELQRNEPSSWEDALELSVFGKLPAEIRDRLLRDHRDVTVKPQHRFMGPDQPAPYRTGLVVDGLLRMFVQSPDGRQINFRYAAKGYFLGAAAIAGGVRPEVVVGVESVTAARVIYLNSELTRHLAREEPAIGWALLEQMVIYQRDILHVLAGTAFGSIRQRVAMHLLNLSTASPTPSQQDILLAPVTQQALADAVGSTRRPVARALSELREAGAIETLRNCILICDAERLATEAQALIGA